MRQAFKLIKEKLSFLSLILADANLASRLALEARSGVDEATLEEANGLLKDLRLVVMTKAKGECPEVINKTLTSIGNYKPSLITFSKLFSSGNALGLVRLLSESGRQSAATNEEHLRALKLQLMKKFDKEKFKHFHILMPPLMTLHTEVILKLRAKKKVISEDGFALGVTFILALLAADRVWTPLKDLNAELKSVEGQEMALEATEKLKQALAPAKMRLKANIKEYQLLECNLALCRLLLD